LSVLVLLMSLRACVVVDIVRNTISVIYVGVIGVVAILGMYMDVGVADAVVYVIMMMLR